MFTLFQGICILAVLIWPKQQQEALFKADPRFSNISFKLPLETSDCISDTSSKILENVTEVDGDPVGLPFASHDGVLYAKSGM